MSTATTHRGQHLADLLDRLCERENLPEIEYGGTACDDLDTLLADYSAAYVNREPDGGPCRYYLNRDITDARGDACHDALGPTHEEPVAILDLDAGTYRLVCVSVTFEPEVTA